MTLKLYGDLLSQPTRAVALFCLANKIDYELVIVNLPEQENRKPPFRAINPRGQVPAIDDDGFKLSESATILRYLAASRSVADHWYPADLKARACVDCVLDWHHTNLRQTSVYVYHKEIEVHLFKGPAAPEGAIKAAEDKMRAAFQMLEMVFLTEEGPFLLGASQPSVADILLACELTQTQFLTESDQERLFGSKPKIKKWLDVMEKSLAPHWAEVHRTIPELVKILEAARSCRQ